MSTLLDEIKRDPAARAAAVLHGAYREWLSTDPDDRRHCNRFQQQVAALMADPALMLDLAIASGAITRATADESDGGQPLWFGEGEGPHDPGWVWFKEPDEGLTVRPLYVGAPVYFGESEG